LRFHRSGSRAIPHSLYSAKAVKILVLNCGSSSLKFQLIETTPERIASDTDVRLAQGLIEKIGSGEAFVSYQQQDRPAIRETCPILKHKEAIQTAFDLMTAQNAALHNPHNLKGYYAAKALLPHAKNVAVFDTSFHQTMPANSYLYGIPYLYYTRNKVRRYGFHGTSHRYISYRYARIHNGVPADFNLITCHLGNGCSVCAIDHGKSVDTSMGLTPMEGLLMGTRPGDIDAGAVMYMIERAEMGLHEVDVLLNRQSGLYGISGVSNDMRELMKASRDGNQRATTAIDIFCYRVKKYIGAYLATLNGAEAIIFAGGIGENAAPIRAQICSGLDGLGIAVDSQKNDAAVGREADISSATARIPTWVIPTNEELLIARDTLRCILHIPHP
jgi:acetate kinase